MARKYQEEEKKRETLGGLKQNMIFRQRLMRFRDQMQEYTLELCKEEGKRDYDRMAEFISENENMENSEFYSQCLVRISKISPTFREADERIANIMEASKIKGTKIMNYILEKLLLKKG